MILERLLEALPVTVVATSEENHQQHLTFERVQLKALIIALPCYLQ
jgi:hypothetical protein